MTLLKIIATDIDPATHFVTRAEVRPDSAPNRGNTTPAEFTSTSYSSISDCKRFISNQPDTQLSTIVFL
jgi:hypothetical protein